VGEDRLRISEFASNNLYNLLNSAGNLRNRTASQIHERLIEVVNRLWEGGKVQSFTDNRGGGWIIDISRGFGDVMLYAIVRNINGNRAVVDVIDENDLETMKSGPAPKEKGWAEGGELKSPLPSLPLQTEPNPESPVLLRWVSSVEIPPGETDNHPVWSEERLIYGHVSDKVQWLLAKGIKSEDIEIWTELKKPKVSVVLV